MPTYGLKEYKKLIRPLPDFVERDIYDIPIIKKQNIDIDRMNNGLWLINMHNVRNDDKNKDKKIVHTFHNDNDLLRAYNNIDNFLKKTSGYYATSTFDFSMDKKMDFPQILSAVYANRWSGSYMQSNGKKVTSCVGWLDKTTYDVCFAGLEDGSVFIISNIGTKNEESYTDFINGYYELRKRFPNSKIICVGSKSDGMDLDVCYVKYEETFGNWDKYKKYWQPQLFNWNEYNAQDCV